MNDERRGLMNGGKTAERAGRYAALLCCAATARPGFQWGLIPDW